MIDIPMNSSAPTSLSIVSTQSQTPRQSEGVRLRKGQKTNLLSKSGKPLSNLKIGLYWTLANTQVDLDTSCFMLGDNGKVIGDDWFVFYGSTQSPDGSIIHSGDSKYGALIGDDETISIDLRKINSRCKKLVFVVTINEARERYVNFSSVSEAGVHILDGSDNQELCNFKLTDCTENVISMVVGEVYNYNGQWKFNPIGEGLDLDLYGLCDRYGVNVIE